MSLKVFHVIFIVLAIALSIFCSGWAFMNSAAPLFAWGTAVFAVLIAVYGVWFLRKARNIIT